MKIEKVVKRLCELKISKCAAREHANEYLEISNALGERGAENPDFQRKFSSFYILRRAKEYKKRYFWLIAKGERDLLQILHELYNANHSIDFSFATKAIHMLDKNAPIWDANVEDVLGTDFEIECRVATYDKLKRVQKQLLKNRKLRKRLAYIRSLLEPTQRGISDAKLLDFLMWKAGKKMKVV